jgi:ABC-2 type transport system permease protein
MLDFVNTLARLVGLELRRSWILTWRYRTEAILSLSFLVALFYGLLFGTRSTALKPFSMGNGTEGLLLGFICWILCTSGVSQIAHDIEEEAKTGTLEPLFLGHPGPATLFAARNLAGLISGVPMLLGVAAALAVATHSTFHLSPEALVPLLALDLAASGIGFALGALAILVKRVRLAVIAGQLLVALVMVAHIDFPEQRGSLMLLPLVPAVESLRGLMLTGTPVGASRCALLALNGAAYFGGGLSVFLLAIQRARRLGLLSQH